MELRDELGRLGSYGRVKSVFWLDVVIRIEWFGWLYVCIKFYN